MLYFWKALLKQKQKKNLKYEKFHLQGTCTKPSKKWNFFSGFSMSRFCNDKRVKNNKKLHFSENYLQSILTYMCLSSCFIMKYYFY